MLVHLSTIRFITDIADFKHGNNWQYKGAHPCVILFQTDEHLLQKGFRDVYDPLASEFPSVRFYQVIIERDPEIPNAYGIHIFPTTMFIPLHGQPSILSGFLTPEQAREHTLKIK